MFRNKKLQPLAFAKLQSRLFAFFGLLASVVYSVGGLVYDAFTTGLNAGTALAFLAIIGMPFLFACFGFLLGLLVAPLFNWWKK